MPVRCRWLLGLDFPGWVHTEVLDDYFMDYIPTPPSSGQVLAMTNLECATVSGPQTCEISTQTDLSEALCWAAQGAAVPSAASVRLACSHAS